MATLNLTAAQLRELLHYEPQTGVFTRLKARASTHVGKPAGCVNRALGYVVVSVLGQAMYGHRLAFLYMTGKWPSGEVDHINGCRADNCWSNLRDITKAENIQNIKAARSHKRSGLLGAYFNKRAGTWRSVIAINKRQVHIGTFATPELAHQAYLDAKRRLHVANTL